MALLSGAVKKTTPEILFLIVSRHADGKCFRKLKYPAVSYMYIYYRISTQKVINVKHFSTEYSIFVFKTPSEIMFAFVVHCRRILLASAYYKNLDSQARLPRNLF